jgi:hypothetical protein
MDGDRRGLRAVPLPRVTQRLAVLTLVGLCAAACAGRHPRVFPDIGIKACPAGVNDLLSVDALQCWFSAPHGRWRTLSHESHYAVLVVQVEAADIRDAAGIARRFVDAERGAFAEILLYVQREARTDGDPIRRLRWTADLGFESLDFSASAR